MLSDEAWLAIARDVGRAQFSIKASMTLGIPFQGLGNRAAPAPLAISDHEHLLGVWVSNVGLRCSISRQLVPSPGRYCHSTLSLTVIDCRSLGIHTVILRSLLSFSVKMTVSPPASHPRLD